MSLIWKDRVKETSTTTGTGAFTLAGAVDRFRTFASVMSVNDTCYYSIEGAAGTGEWETGIGTYSGTNTLTRTTVLDSSNSGSAVSFSAGTKTVILTQLANRSSSIVMGPDWTDLVIGGSVSKYGLTIYESATTFALGSGEPRLELEALLYYNNGLGGITLGIGDGTNAYFITRQTDGNICIYKRIGSTTTLLGTAFSQGATMAGFKRLGFVFNTYAASSNNFYGLSDDCHYPSNFTNLTDSSADMYKTVTPFIGAAGISPYYLRGRKI